MTAAFALLMLTQTIQPAGSGEIAYQIACAPASVPAPPIGGIRVTGSAVPGRRMFGPGEPLVINAGTAQGVRTGQMFYVRRYVKDRFTPASPDFTLNSIHTSGWVTVVDARDSMAVVTVTHACDGVMEGDFLEPYVDPVVPAPAQPAEPDFAHPGRIVMADERRQIGYAGLVMLLNRGTEHGVRPGQAITIYRETTNGTGPTLMVGDATVLSVGPQLSLVRIDSSRDAVYIGDLAAIHRTTR